MAPIKQLLDVDHQMVAKLWKLLNCSALTNIEQVEPRTKCVNCPEQYSAHPELMAHITYKRCKSIGKSTELSIQQQKQIQYQEFKTLQADINALLKEMRQVILKFAGDESKQDQVLKGEPPLADLLGTQYEVGQFIDSLKVEEVEYALEETTAGLGQIQAGLHQFEAGYKTGIDEVYAGLDKTYAGISRTYDGIDRVHLTLEHYHLKLNHAYYMLDPTGELDQYRAMATELRQDLGHQLWDEDGDEDGDD